MRSRRPARATSLRLAQAVVLQGARSLRFDLDPARAPGTALVTGGNRGIGAAVTTALAAAGTDVTVAARGVGDGPGTARLDLADLDDVAAAAARLADRSFDLVVLNAGVAPAAVERSAQGHELAFAVNVLGHHLLLDRLLAGGAVAGGARVVVVTGDIAALARNCTPNFTSDHRRAGAMAYARSKLGDLWLAAELARRRPDLHVVAVHPGVVRSGLGELGGGRARRWQRLTHITPERAARAVLAAACDPAVPSGGYLHNTLGLVRLRPGDPAADAGRAGAFVDLLDELSAPWR